LVGCTKARVKSNYHAFLMCGILFEKQRLFNFALDYYKSLLECPNSDLVEIGRRCYARVLGHLNRYEEALVEYKKIDFKANIEDTFALAKIFYKVGKYQQAFMSKLSNF
jgi:tetratricopeptide (TPR) repeat protein